MFQKVQGCSCGQGCCRALGITRMEGRGMGIGTTTRWTPSPPPAGAPPYPSCTQQPDRLRVLFSLVGPQRVSLRNHQPCPFVMARNFRAGVPALHLINQSLMSIRLTAHNSVVGSGQVLCRGPERDGGAEQRERRPLRPHLLLLVRTKR